MLECVRYSEAEVPGPSPMWAGSDSYVRRRRGRAGVGMPPWASATALAPTAMMPSKLAGPPQLPDVMALAGRYGLQFGQPDWLPELITRYHLTPPPGA